MVINSVFVIIGLRMFWCLIIKHIENQCFKNTHLLKMHTKWEWLRQRSSLTRGYIILHKQVMYWQLEWIHPDHQTDYLRPILFTQPNKITFRPWFLFFMQHHGHSVSTYPRGHFTPIKGCLDGLTKSYMMMIFSCMIFLFRRHDTVMCGFLQKWRKLARLLELSHHALHCFIAIAKKLS